MRFLKSVRGSLDVLSLTALAFGLMFMIMWCVSMRH